MDKYAKGGYGPGKVKSIFPHVRWCGDSRGNLSSWIKKGQCQWRMNDRSPCVCVHVHVHRYIHEHCLEQRVTNAHLLPYQISDLSNRMHGSHLYHTERQGLYTVLPSQILVNVHCWITTCIGSLVDFMSITMFRANQRLHSRTMVIGKQWLLQWSILVNGLLFSLGLPAVGSVSSLTMMYSVKSLVANVSFVCQRIICLKLKIGNGMCKQLKIEVI